MNTPFKGEIAWLPDFIGEELMNQQELQRNKRDISVFERNIESSSLRDGFSWLKTNQGDLFWRKVLKERDINLFLAWFKPELEVFDDTGLKYTAQVVGCNNHSNFPFYIKELLNGDYSFKYARLPKKENAEKLELLKQANELLTKAAELKAAAEKL